jgi:hypothetical protein
MQILAKVDLCSTQNIFMHKLGKPFTLRSSGSEHRTVTEVIGKMLKCRKAIVYTEY